MASADKLAILDGKPVLGPDAVEPWPPVDDTDRRMVLDTLESGEFAFAANSKAWFHVRPL